MADEIVSAPGGGAPPASEAAPAAPTGTPATPTPEATPAPVAATPAAPATPAPLTKNVGEDDTAFLSRVRAASDAKPAVDDPAKPEPVKATETPKPAEPVKTEADPAKPAEEAKVEEDPLDKLGPLPASKMAELLAANPELDAALEKAVIKTEDGQEIPLKDALYDSLRSAAVGQQFREVFPDVETAKFAQERAAAFGVMDQKFTEIKRGDAASTADFVQNVLMPQSYLLDENGEVKIDAKSGMPMHDGTVPTFLDNLFDTKVDYLKWQAENFLKNGTEEQKELAEQALASLDVLKQFAGGGSSEKDVPEELKQQKADLDAREQALAATKNTEAETRFQNFTTSVETASNEKVNSLVDDFLSKSSLAPDSADSEQEKGAKEFSRKAVLDQIRVKVFERLKDDRLFAAQQEQIARRGPGESTKTALVNLYNRHTNAILEKIAAPILRNAGAVRVRQSQARQAKLATQAKVTTMEPRGTVQAAIPTTPKVDTTALMRQARTELTAQNRREPSGEELMTHFRKLEKVALAQSA